MKLDRSKLAIIVIFILALSVRLIYFYQIKPTPLFGLFAVDSEYYDRFALKILGGNLLFGESIYLHPFYPFFLALIYRIFGHSFTAVGLCQVVLDSVTCALIYLISIKIFNKRSIGLAASFIYALYKMAIFYTGFLLDTTLSVFLVTSMIVLIIYATEKKTPVLWLISGFITALLALLKPYIILFLPCLILLYFYTREIKYEINKKAINTAIFLTGILIVLLPFSIRNYMIEKTFSPFSVHSGWNFYVGNNLNASGTYVSLIGVTSSPIEEVRSSTFKAREERGKILSASQASYYWFLKGLLFIRDNPGRYLSLLVKKFFLYWNKEEITTNINYSFCKARLPLLSLPLFSFGVTAPFALLGIVFALTQRLRKSYIIILFIATNMVALILIFVTARHRFMSSPFMIILATFALYKLALFLKQRETKRFFLSFGFLLIFFLLINKINFYMESKNNYVKAFNNAGNVYAKRSMLDEAIAEYKKALEIDPDFATTHNNLGNAYAKKGMFEEAIIEYKKALEMGSVSAGTHYNLGNAYFSKGSLEQAIAEYQEAIKIDSTFATAHYNLAVCYYNKKDFEKAAYHCDKAIKHGFEVKPGFLLKLRKY